MFGLRQAGSAWAGTHAKLSWEYLIQFSTVLLTSFTKILLTQSVAEVQGLSKELLDLKWHPT